MMKSISNNIDESESVSEFIYFEIESFLTVPSFDFFELYEIMNNIMSRNNPIANGNILMTINKAITLNSQQFIDFYINEQFIENLIYIIYNSQIKSSKREAIILLTTFISKLDQVKDKAFAFPLLNIRSILDLLNIETTTLATLKYLNSIIINHPNELAHENLPLDFDINFLLCELLKKYNTETSFNIKIESSFFITNLIGHDFIDKNILIKNYSQILSILLNIITADFDETGIFIEILIKICSDFLAAGITQDSIQQFFILNDTEVVFDECLEKHSDLTNHIQSLTKLIFN